MCFTCFSSSVTTDTDVTSDPVPLVVGMAIKLILSLASVEVFKKYITPLAVSIAEPPPKPIICSASSSVIMAVAFETISKDGSGFTSSKILTLLLESILDSILSIILFFTRNESTTINILEFFIFFKCSKESLPMYIFVC